MGQHAPQGLGSQGLNSGGSLDRLQAFDGLPSGQRALLWLQGADPMSFGGGSARPVPAVGPFRRHGPAASLEPVHHAVVARVTGLWWQAHLLGDSGAHTALRGPLGLGEGDRFRAN